MAVAASDLQWLGLSQSKVAETLRNSTLSQQLGHIMQMAKKALSISGRSTTELPKQRGSLLYQLATKAKAQCAHHLPAVVALITGDKIKNELQVTAAVAYILSHSMQDLDEAELEKECGVGVVVTEDQIEDTVKDVIASNKNAIILQRYRFPTGTIIGEVRSRLAWADGQYVKREVELQLHELLGPKTEEDIKPKKAEKTKLAKENGKAVKKEVKDSTVEDGAATMDELLRTRAKLHQPGENYKTEGYAVTSNTQELLMQHLKRTGGKVVTRFPPEPNGLLHIGHAKAININFGYAKAFDGICYLRFDDTNPEKEEKKFFDGIEEMVRWLGYVPAKITYSSDHFLQLYQWAVTLIKKGLAYVCHQRVEEMRGFDVKPSPWRQRPMEESLALFEDMRAGKLEEGEATLRLRLVLEEGKVDPVAYRIKFVPHHRTGEQWCIYPTYDYTHCLCDSLEDITHSLCTKEFQSRRSSYYWLCNALQIYCPVQWEYGRLNVNYTVVSKRKILKLITSKIVNDWDDPRLFTLAALRRRGVPPEALNSFVSRLGLTGSQMVVDPHVLDSAIREHLNSSAPRTMAVLDPLKVTISNWSQLYHSGRVDIPDFPSESSRSGRHCISFASTIYIERDDYRQGPPPKEFRRLSCGQPVGLKHIGLLLIVEEEKTAPDGAVVEIVVRAEELTIENKPGAFIHWVADPMIVRVRLYERLFKHSNPEDATAVPAGFLSDCNEDSLTILHGVYVDKYLHSARVYDKFQFERIGFFSVDPDSCSGKLVFNRTVLLKEDSAKC